MINVVQLLQCDTNLFLKCNINYIYPILALTFSSSSPSPFFQLFVVTTIVRLG